MVTLYNYDDPEKNVSSATKVKEASSKRIEPFKYPAYTPPTAAAPVKEKISKGKIVKESVRAGAASMFSSIASGINEYNKFIYGKLGNGKDAFGKEYAPTYDRGVQNITEFEKKVQDRLIAKIGEDGANTYLSKATMALTQGVGQIAAFALNPIVGVTTIAAQTVDAGKDAYNTAYREVLNEGKSEEEAKKIANINGIVTGSVGMLEVLPIMRLMGLPKGLLTKPISKTLTKTLLRTGKTVATEAGTEGAQQFAQDFTAQQTYADDETPLRNAIESVLVSIPTALLFGGAGEINMRKKTATLNKAKEDISKQVEAAGATPEQAVKVSDMVVDQYAVLGDEGVFEENEAQRQDKLIQLIPQIEDAVLNGDQNLLNSINNLANKTDNAELKKSVEEALKKAEDMQVELRESQIKVQEALDERAKEATIESNLIKRANLPYTKEDRVQLIPAEGLMLESGQEKHPINNPEVKNYVKDIEEKIPNPAYINKATAEELARIRDNMNKLAERVAKQEMPSFAEKAEEGKVQRKPTKLEEIAAKKLSRKIKGAISAAASQASNRLSSEFGIEEGGYPKTVRKTLEKVKPETPKEPTENERLASRVYDRLRDEHPDELSEEVSYEAIKLKEDAEKAVELLAADKEKAYRIAMMAETSPEVTSTAVNIAMADKALLEGNIDLFNQLTKVRSLEQTRRGQEIVAEKGSVSDNSTSRYVKELINAKMEKLGKSYLGSLKDYNPFGKKQSNSKKATEIIKNEVAKAKKTTQTKAMDLKEAQSFLDKLACA